MAEKQTREQFIKGYCERSGMSWESLSARRQVVPCECEEDICTGWAMVPKDEPAVPGVPLAAPTVTDEQLTASFTKTHSGPNPFYACVHCGASVPGLREYLVSHFNTHGVTSLVGVGTDQIEQPTATHGASHLYGVRASDAAVPVQPQPEGGNGN